MQILKDFTVFVALNTKNFFSAKPIITLKKFHLHENLFVFLLQIGKKIQKKGSNANKLGLLLQFVLYPNDKMNRGIALAGKFNKTWGKQPEHKSIKSCNYFILESKEVQVLGKIDVTNLNQPNDNVIGILLPVLGKRFPFD